MPLRQNIFLRHYRIIDLVSGDDLDLWPLTLKTFSAMPTHMMNISGKFYIEIFTLCNSDG